VVVVAGRTKAALYERLDHGLSWSEDELPQVERTKHVHGLHPYLGKFIPQLVEVFLARHFVCGSIVLDPFAGSGTTLVEANANGIGAVGCDISAFNCLLASVKTERYSLPSLELALRGALAEAVAQVDVVSTESAGPWLEEWFAPRALADLVAYRRALDRLEAPSADVARIILARSARSARLTTHFDLDFPRTPATGSYHCFKHKRTCRPVEEAGKFLRRYTEDTIRRLRRFAELRTGAPVRIVHGDTRSLELTCEAQGIITSPPYPGLIDYHEQHRYAYELLGLRERAHDEIGAASRGSTRGALAEYVEAMTRALGNAVRPLRAGAPVVIVVNDSHGLYRGILEGAELELVERITRHVNRRTGRRSGEFFEDVLVCSAPGQ